MSPGEGWREGRQREGTRLPAPGTACCGPRLQALVRLQPDSLPWLLRTTPNCLKYITFQIKLVEFYFLQPSDS